MASGVLEGVATHDVVCQVGARRSVLLVCLEGERGVRGLWVWGVFCFWGLNLTECWVLGALLHTNDSSLRTRGLLFSKLTAVGSVGCGISGGFEQLHLADEMIRVYTRADVLRWQLTRLS